MADDRTGAAVINGRISRCIEDRWLQNPSREDDIPQTAIVGVVSLRRHSPVTAIDRTRKTTGQVSPIKRGTTKDVADKVILLDDELRVIARMIRISDLDRISVELLERFHLRRVAHPIELFDARVKRILQIAN